MLQIQQTRDGSFTIFNPHLNAHYHSIHGALTESRHVFILHGLIKILGDFPQEDINIFEMGLGTGLNAFLSAIEASGMKRSICFDAVESFPPENLIWQEFIAKHSTLFNEQQISEWQAIGNNTWDKTYTINPFFSFTKHNKLLDDFHANKKFHLIYWDAFAFDVHPEQWSEETFQKVKEMMHKNACLVTYAAKGIIKRNFKKVGLKLQTLPGPPGKREMIRLINSD